MRVLPIVIHDRNDLAAVIFRTTFRDIDHAAVKVAGLARDAGIDLIGNLVRQTTPAIDTSDQLLPLAHLSACEHVIETELHDDLAALHSNCTCDQGLGVDGAPIWIGGRGVKDVLADKSRGWDLTEQPRARQILCDHTSDIRGHILGPSDFRLECRDRIGERFDDTIGDGQTQGFRNDRCAQKNHQQKGHKLLKHSYPHVPACRSLGVLALSLPDFRNKDRKNTRKDANS